MQTETPPRTNLGYELLAFDSDCKQINLPKILSYEEHPDLLSFSVEVDDANMQDFIYGWILGNNVDYFVVTRFDKDGNEAFITKHVMEDVVDWMLSGSLEKEEGRVNELTLTFSTSSTVIVRDRNGQIEN